MKHTALTLAALLVLSVPASAQQKLVWENHETEDGAALVYGVPESEVVDLFFICQKGKEAVVVQSMIGTKGLKKDEAARIILTAGKVKKTFEGKAVTTEDSAAVNVEAAGTMADLKALLKGGAQLSIETKGAKKSIPLAGVADAAGKFEAACKAAAAN